MGTERSLLRMWEAASTMEGEGFVVHRPFPRARHEHLDPFLLLDHVGPVCWQPGEARGMGLHPHRGYELLTVVLEGELVQRDVHGRGCVLAAGEASRIVAGAGLVHEERPSDVLRHRGGRFHAFQLWINLRARDKRLRVRWEVAGASRIATKVEDGCVLRVMAGALGALRGPLNGPTEVTVALVDLEPGVAWSESLAADEMTAAYVLEGAMVAGPMRRPVVARTCVQWANDGERIGVEAGEQGAKIVLLSGRPLLERVYWHGPFVMNAPDEIAEAITDYYTGRLMDAAVG
ncbi:MAG: pirin family protein [Myxococcota bacterium]|nr:pirin family protein [Myxococcota bacterium]